MVIVENGIKTKRHVINALRYVLLDSKISDPDLIKTRYASGQRSLNRAMRNAADDVVAQSIITEQRVQQLMDNIIDTCGNRKHRRKDNNLCFHTVVSFHKKEKRLSKDQMLDFMRTYIKDRFPKSVLLMVPHAEDTEHLHFHCIASATDINRNGVWLSKTEHLEHKIRMQDFANKAFNLKYSTVDHKREGRSISDKNPNQIGRTNPIGKLNEKEELKLILAEAYDQSLSRENFYERLTKRGVQLYFRGGKPGIKMKKLKYRMSSLGYSFERIQLLELEKSKRFEELQRMIQNRVSLNQERNK